MDQTVTAEVEIHIGHLDVSGVLRMEYIRAECRHGRRHPVLLGA
jgi:hypothetical protein